MSANVYWMLALKVNEGKRGELDGLMSDMVEHARTHEPGTLNYEWSLAEDGGSCHIYERYVDSDAVLTHLAAFGVKFAARFVDCLTPTDFHVYGSPTDEVKAALADIGPVYMTPWAGFVR